MPCYQKAVVLRARANAHVQLAAADPQDALGRHPRRAGTHPPGFCPAPGLRATSGRSCAAGVACGGWCHKPPRGAGGLGTVTAAGKVLLSCPNGKALVVVFWQLSWRDALAREHLGSNHTRGGCRCLTSLAPRLYATWRGCAGIRAAVAGAVRPLTSATANGLHGVRRRGRESHPGVKRGLVWD